MKGSPSLEVKGLVFAFCFFLKSRTIHFSQASGFFLFPTAVTASSMTSLLVWSEQTVVGRTHDLSKETENTYWTIKEETLKTHISIQEKHLPEGSGGLWFRPFNNHSHPHRDVTVYKILPHSQPRAGPDDWPQSTQEPTIPDSQLHCSRHSNPALSHPWVCSTALLSALPALKTRPSSSHVGSGCLGKGVASSSNRWL